MNNIAMRFEHVSKCFKRGESFDSLRDLVPALMRRAMGRPERTAESRDFWALNDISVEIRQGETVGIIGHNGAGKSTMLKHLAGIMVPTRGKINVCGRLSALIEVGAGFHQDLTGRENVFLNGVILGMTRTEVARKFDEIVEFSGLADFIDTPVKRYSSGMYARLGFSVAAHLDPDILIIDEVLSVGDFVFQQKSLQKMRSIAKGGATVIFVSHNLKAVSDLCERVMLLEAGKVVADGPSSDVVQTYLRRERAKMSERRNTEVEIQAVEMRGSNGSAVHFRPGDRAWIDITFHANKPCEHVAVVLQVVDEGLVDVFNTSSERLGTSSVSLEQGQSCRLTFGLNMHLANGTFHVAVYLHRYDLEREYDKALPAITFFVESEIDVKGSANLYPFVSECHIN